MSRAHDEVGEPAAPSASSLAELLEQAEVAIAHQQDVVHERAELETKLASARSERDNARLSLAAAEAELEAWQAAWSALMTRIGLEATAAPEQAEVVLTGIAELRKALDDRRGFLSRIHGIDRDADQFARDVAVLAAHIAPDLVDRPWGEQTRELARRLRNAQKADTLREQKQHQEKNLRAAETEREAATMHLKRLCREAGCTELDHLHEAERRSHSRARLEHERDACDDALAAAAAGSNPSSFAAEVENTDPDALEVSILDVERRISGLDHELQCVDQKIGTERAELARMDGGDRAAEIAEGAQTLLAQLQGEVTRYVTLKLAEEVLKRGIERYREKNQGPILARASSLFSSLTGGSFARLQIDDEEGHSVLKGVRPDGRHVGVEGMSDGSHDQLYLALRLASLESWISSHEPIPFVVDDILLNFDDLRATAALPRWPSSHGKPRCCFSHTTATSSNWPAPPFLANWSLSMSWPGRAPLRPTASFGWASKPRNETRLIFTGSSHHGAKIMPSPFPGMDPFLEGSTWMNFDGQLCAEIARQLGPKLRPHYVAPLSNAAAHRCLAH